jgi:hypothetical protein
MLGTHLAHCNARPERYRLAWEMPAQIDVPVGSVPEGWGHARLIPTFGIRNQQEQEKRATSCLLAVMHGVPEFGHALLKELDAPKAPAIETFAEVRFKDANGKTVIPDGAIVCRRGKKIWTCLVEVKTGSAQLKDEQVSAYLDIAKANQFDGVLTISTQITASSSESPVSVDRRKLRGGLCLWHFSWWRVLTEAIVQQRYRGISDPDQEWILRELIHYLISEASGAVGFEDMGDKWVPVRNAARERSLRKGDAAAREVAERWEQFANYLGLSLSQELGANVTVSRPRGQTTPARLDELVQGLEERGELTSTLRVPDAVGPLTIRSNLRSRQTFVSVAIDAPREGRSKSRFNWLLRQLKQAPDDLLIEASFPNARATTAARLGEVREDPTPLYYPPDSKREPKTFIVTQSRPMGQKRGRTEGSFVRETSAQTVTFYRDIVQNLKGWYAPAPKLHTEPAAPSDSPAAEQVMLPAWASDDIPAPTIEPAS